MSLRRIALHDFDEWVALNGYKYPKDLIEGLHKHPRFNNFIDNIALQLKIISNRKTFFNRRQILKTAVYNMAQMFAELVMIHRNEYLMSDIAKSMVRQEASKYDDAEKELADEGIIIDDGSKEYN